MRHFGDITKLHGKDLPPVDIICGGSPCQDLSVAGLRAGLSGERSSLFLDQIRIIKELHNECRQSNVDIRPRFMVWENVPGALSSNGGEDFRAVLEQTARVADDNAVIPRLPDGVAWTNAGAVVGDRWSLAWRIHNAQFWGVPQRRARLCLVADFRGQTAPEILFERKSLSRGTEPRPEERQGLATDTQRGTRETGEAYTLKVRGGVETDSNGRTAGKGALVQKELSATLGTTQDQTLFCIDQGGGKGNVNISDNLSPTLSTTNDGAPVVCMDAHQHYGYRENEATGTLTAGQNSTVRGDTPLIVNAFEQTAYDKYTDTQTAPTLKQSGGNFGGGSELLVKQ